MAVIEQGVLGGFSGTVGTVVGGNWKGIDYMRGKSKRRSNPNSPAQEDQRTRFGIAGKFLRPMIPFLRIGFKNYAVKMSGYNAAMAYTLENALIGAYPAYEIDYAKVLVTEGLLSEALNPAAVSTTAAKIEFTWADNSDDTYAHATDKAMLVVYNPAKKRAVTIVAGNTRSAGSQVVTLPANYSGDDVQCYIGFQNGNQSVMSNSQFVIGLIVM